jgi:hypothetical protein
MGERIQNNVLTISFTDLIRDWFLGHVTHWTVGPTPQYMTRDYKRTFITPNVYTPTGSDLYPEFYGIIVDEARPYIFFRYPHVIEPGSAHDVRAIYPTSLSFFDDLLLSIRTIDAHMRQGYQCKGHPGKFRITT